MPGAMYGHWGMYSRFKRMWHFPWQLSTNTSGNRRRKSYCKIQGKSKGQSTSSIHQGNAPTLRRNTRWEQTEVRSTSVHQSSQNPISLSLLDRFRLFFSPSERASHSLIPPISSIISSSHFSSSSCSFLLFFFGGNEGNGGGVVFRLGCKGAIRDRLRRDDFNKGE